MFQSQFYSWDSFTDLDKLSNHNQYYWLPSGPPAVTVSSDAVVYNSQEFVVTDQANGYLITLKNSVGGTVNPVLTLLRGGVYTFAVNQSSQFWIQTEPGTSGVEKLHPNITTREVYGVSNNGAQNGFVTFAVPGKDAQNQYQFSSSISVDLVSTRPFDQINDMPLYSYTDPETGIFYQGVDNIDGVTSIEGLTVLFYTGTSDNSDNFYTVELLGNPSNPIVRLNLADTIPNNTNIWR